MHAGHDYRDYVLRAVRKRDGAWVRLKTFPPDGREAAYAAAQRKIDTGRYSEVQIRREVSTNEESYREALFVPPFTPARAAGIALSVLIAFKDNSAYRDYQKADRGVGLLNWDDGEYTKTLEFLTDLAAGSVAVTPSTPR